jgi:hypothetical protein
MEEYRRSGLGLDLKDGSPSKKKPCRVKKCFNFSLIHRYIGIIDII